MVEIYLDSADLEEMGKWYPKVQGYTCNPSLMRKAGVTDYKAFARNVLQAIPDKPVSLEVFGDDAYEIRRQADILSALADNVYVKVPVVYTDGSPTYGIIQSLMRSNVKVNVTAVMTDVQMRGIAQCARRKFPLIVSVFAGRIADAGQDPVIAINQACQTFDHLPQVKVLWASTREVLNVKQASETRCHIITVTPDILAKLHLLGKDLTEFSIETSRMFYNDAQKAGFTL